MASPDAQELLDQVFGDDNPYYGQSSNSSWTIVIILGVALLVGFVGVGVFFAAKIARQNALPEISSEPDEIVASARPEVEQQVYKLLAAGKQSDAEELLRQQLSKYPEAEKFSQLIDDGEKREAAKYLEKHTNEIEQAQRIYFLVAATIRSRFNKQDAYVLFKAVFAMNPDTPNGKCALCMMRLDSERGAFGDEQKTAAAFDELRRLVHDYPDDVMMPWMLAVECRTYNRNEEGCDMYRQVLKKWKPGPALVHQTYANLLDERGMHSDALGERYKAVKLEPASWSYGGLGNTLTHLGRHKEARKAYQMAARVAHDARTRRTSATGIHAAEDFDEAIERCQKAAEADPKNWRAWWMWGQALEKQGKLDEALEKYQEALALEPNSNFLQELVNKLEAKLAKP